MGCGCGKKKSQLSANYLAGLTNYTTLITTGTLVPIAASSDTSLTITGYYDGAIIIRTGKMRYIPEDAADDLIGQGAPIWVIEIA